jgi:spermidine synthase
LWLFDLSWWNGYPACLLAPVILLGPLGFLWGLAFPTAVPCFTSDRGPAGQGIAALYAWNTLGCIGGALAAGLVFIPYLGAGPGGSLVSLLSLLLGLVLLGVHPGGWLRAARLLDWAVVGATAALLLVVDDPYFRVMHQRLARHYNGEAVLYRHLEESAGTTTAFGARNGGPQQKTLWVNGQPMTTKSNSTKLMAHLPLWLADNPRDVLVICFGMGTTFRSATRHEGMDVQAVELVPGVLKCFGHYHADGPALLEEPHYRVTVDDGRNHLLMHDRSYDVITVDVAPPIESAGTVNLYSREFFALCRQRLRPGGVLCFWVPNSPGSEIKMIMRTFLDVFPEGGVWSAGVEDNNWASREPVSWFMGFLLVGSPSRLSRPEVGARIRRGYTERAAVADLREWTTLYDTPDQVINLFVADGEQLQPFLADVPIITDDHPWTEFPLGRVLLRGDAYAESLDPARMRDWVAGKKSPGLADNMRR